MPLDQLSTLVDVGCGTGLATVPFAEALPSKVEIFGLDSSESQIEEARKNTKLSNVKYSVYDVSNGLPFPDNQVDIITAVQSAHWLDLDVFFPECKRVLKPSAVLACIGCNIPKIEVPGATTELNEKLWELQNMVQKILKCTEGYWFPTMREKVKNQYQSFELPFEDQLSYRDDKSLHCRYECSFGEYKNFVETWSAVILYRKKYLNTV